MMQFYTVMYVDSVICPEDESLSFGQEVAACIADLCSHQELFNLFICSIKVKKSEAKHELH